MDKPDFKGIKKNLSKSDVKQNTNISFSFCYLVNFVCIN